MLKTLDKALYCTVTYFDAFSLILMKNASKESTSKFHGPLFVALTPILPFMWGALESQHIAAIPAASEVEQHVHFTWSFLDRVTLVIFFYVFLYHERYPSNIWSWGRDLMPWNALTLIQVFYQWLLNVLASKTQLILYIEPGSPALCTLLCTTALNRI